LVSDFNATYWASKAPEILKLRDAVRVHPEDAYAISRAFAESLAARGKLSAPYLVDVPIMTWGWDPLLTMQLRMQYGYMWVPSALTPPVEVAPGIVVPGMPSYDPNNPPPLSIKVSVDPADYPEFKA
jgi:hypothetical protein